MREETLTLEYWEDEGWFVGHLVECPEVNSQGKTLEELEENIRDAYRLIRSLPDGAHTDGAHRKSLVLTA
jgi:hypothetical protein